jgi:hypothetical protein
MKPKTKPCGLRWKSKLFATYAFASVLCLASWPSFSAAETKHPVTFNRDIRPIMSDTCFKCHGPATQKARLRLDSRERAIKPNRDGVVSIVPGKPEQSEVIRRIFSVDEEDIMPPPDSHSVLTNEQKNTIREWIRQGAEYENHWSFEAITKPLIPKAPTGQFKTGQFKIVNPIDLFIAERLGREKLTMAPEADRAVLIRRVAFALTGLPPTPAEVDAYLNDKRKNAYEKMVDRYLSSTRFGEEMARHWLDVARYGDTHGMHLDNERQIWAYRDWVISAFNQNLPYDQFTIQQIAGDLLPNATPQQIAATGFLRCNITTGEGGSIAAEWIYRNAVERTSTVAQAFMGLTAGCAVCHDHKFDPISAKEYYSLYAFFNSAADPALDGNALLTRPTIKLPMAGQKERVAVLDAQIATKQNQLKSLVAKLAYIDPAIVKNKPGASVSNVVLFDDTIPPGSKITASPGHPTKYVSAKDGQVRSGKTALKRTDKGLTQDVIEQVVNVASPPGGSVYVHVYIDPKDVPKTLMIQYLTTGWLHRAVWGDYNAITWGAAGTTQRVHIGKLPEVGKWVRLEVPTKTIGLTVGQKITGFAFTQFGGTVYWDLAGITGTTDPTTDPRRSLQAWWKQQAGKNTPGLPNDLKAIVKAGPNGKTSAELKKKLRDYYLMNVCSDTKSNLVPMRNELAALRKQKTDVEKSSPGTFIYRDLPKPRQSFVMLRGQYNKPGDKVEPNTPAIFPSLKKEDPKRRANRLDLARWLVSKEHPLTARVQANRLWQQFFGTGIVETSDDFGSQGAVPSHPELLDWLALQLHENDWDIKKQVKLMIMSAAFRQSSRITQQTMERDPDNRLYARGPRFRLGAEQIRDNALFVSGLLDSKMGGKGVKPYQPPNIWEPVGFVGSNTSRYAQDKGASLYRRSIYAFLKRTAPPPFMSNFDAPSREASCAKRERSNSPLQALQLMNDVQQVEAARALAQRIMIEGGTKPAERIAFAYRTVLAREPQPRETAIVRDALAKHLLDYKASPNKAKLLINNGESKPNAKLNESELAAWTMIASLMLNLDETLNRN